VSDALPLTGLVDGVVLVVRSGVTERRALERAKEQLDRVGARVLGIVLNGLSSRDARYYYAGYKEYEQRAPRKRRSRVGDG
jgi:Mrp family chromosome partitioning ATPase